MESLGNFLQNDTILVQIPQVVAEILRFEIWRVPPFFAKTPIFEGAYLQNYSSDFNKIENIGFFYINSTSKPNFMQIGDFWLKILE